MKETQSASGTLSPRGRDLEAKQERAAFWRKVSN